MPNLDFILSTRLTRFTTDKSSSLSMLDFDEIDDVLLRFRFNSSDGLRFGGVAVCINLNCGRYFPAWRTSINLLPVCFNGRLVKEFSIANVTAE